MTGVAQNLPGEPAPVNQGRLMMYTSTGEWLPAKDRLSAYAGSGVGPGLWFADNMATLCPGTTVGVIMCAKGGTYLAQWMPDYSMYSMYGNMIAKASAAKQYGRICGLVWYQGEAETTDRENVVLYTQRMHTLFNSICQDLEIPDLPIVFVQIGPNPNYPGRIFWRDVQVQQQQIANAHPTGIAMVPNNNATYCIPYHLDQKSQIALGGRIAQAMYDLSFQ